MDIDELKELLKEEDEGAFFIGGFGGAIVERDEIDHASLEELKDIARMHGYEVSIEDNQADESQIDGRKR